MSTVVLGKSAAEIFSGDPGVVVSVSEGRNSCIREGVLVVFINV